MVATGRPGFREWPEDQYAPLAPDGATAATRLGPVVGDFDGDGQPDVVLDGWDPNGELVPVVLSEPRPAEAPARDRGPGRRDASGPALDAHRRHRPSSGKASLDRPSPLSRGQQTAARVESQAAYIYVDGHFSRLIAGE